MNEPVARAARAEDEQGIRELWTTAFDEPRMVPLWELDPDRYRHTLVIAESDGTIAASVYYLPRQIRNVNGEIDKVAGLANVATLPSARGRGYSRRLLAKHREVAESEGADWALLFTGTPGVYINSGWELFSQRHRRGTIAKQDFSAFLDVTTVVEGSFDQLAIRSLHQPLEQLPLNTVRTDLDWRRTGIWYSESKIFLATQQSDQARHGALGTPGCEILGYIVLDPSHEIVWITEVAAPSLQIARALVAKALDCAQNLRFTEALIRLPDAELAKDVVARFLTNVTWRHDDTAMFLPLGKTKEQIKGTIEHPSAFHSTGDYL